MAITAVFWSRSGQADEEEPEAGKGDEYFGAARQPFIIFAQAAVSPRQEQAHSTTHRCGSTWEPGS